MKTIYVLDWTEFESGWGCRPDGIQVFTSYEELEKILESDRKKRKESISFMSEYSIPTSKTIIEIDTKDFNKIKKLIGKKNSHWFTSPGERDISYIKKTYKSVKVIATENL